MLRRLVLPAGIVIIALFIFAFLKQSEPQKKPSKRTEKSWLVSAVKLDIQDLPPEITLYGRVETPQQATLKSALTADVMTVSVFEGQQVKAGQTLAKLDDTDLLLLLRQRQASVAEIDALIAIELSRYKLDKSLLQQENELLRLAEKALQRADKLNQTQLVSRENLDDQRASKERQILTIKRLQHDIDNHPARLANLKAKRANSQALLDQVKVNLKRTVITAPFDGRIASVNVSPGDRVSTGTALLSIYDLNMLEVRAQLPSRYIQTVRASLKRGEKMQAKAMTDDGQLLDCFLTRLAGEVRLDSGGIDGLFSLTSDNQPLALGTFVELSLKLPPEKAVMAVPFNALYGFNQVYLIKDSRLQSVMVKRVGEYRDTAGKKMLLIRSSDLKQGDNIVSTQLPNVTTGLKVSVLSE